MLRISVPEIELWDPKEERFLYIKPQNIVLEHSLVSVSKWESKWCKPFFSSKELTEKETIDYIRCMTITQNVNPIVYRYLRSNNMEQINRYISHPMSATIIYDMSNNRKNKKIITSEVIYYWMTVYGIPFECQKWHLNRLLKLIKVCSIESQPDRKMSLKDTMMYNKKINEERKKKYNTKG